ncbi:SUKH-4 family immunity protein [Spirillospora sp. NPDC052269]
MLSDDEIRTQAVAAFGDWTLCRVEEQAVLSTIAHEPTRRFLAEVGLPVQGPFFEFDTDFLVRPSTFREQAADDEPGGQRAKMLAEWGHLLDIGDSGDEDLWLDPNSGAVHVFIFGWDAPPCLVNSTLSQYVAALALIERQRFIDGVPLEELDDDDSAYDRLEAIVEQLEESDPSAFDACEHGAPWSGWLDDPIASGGLDWEWSEEALDYFRARGIDPAEREPRRPTDD